MNRSRPTGRSSRRRWPGAEAAASLRGAGHNDGEEGFRERGGQSGRRVRARAAVQAASEEDGLGGGKMTEKFLALSDSTRF